MRRPILPPTYLLVAILLMGALHWWAPVLRFIPFPYSLLGLLPLALGGYVNVWASNYFDRVSTTIKPFQEPTHLITNGFFRYSRHPMYLGMTLILLGLAALLGSLSPLFVVPLFAWAMDRVFIVSEEKDLEAAFGNAYREYRERVRRWL